jgi:hypothetical protein
VDEWVFDFVKDIPWFLHKSSGYVATKCKGNIFTLLHAQIALSPGGLDLCVDHINRNRLDNRTSNLRLISKADNAINVTTKSNVRGVFWHAKNNNYMAKIGRPGIYLGSFTTREEAAIMYDVWARNIFGDLAVLNKGDFL